MIAIQLINIICNADLPITLRQDAQMLLNQLT
jgi:hypothetical protein